MRNTSGNLCKVKTVIRKSFKSGDYLIIPIRIIGLVSLTVKERTEKAKIKNNLR